MSQDPTAHPSSETAATPNDRHFVYFADPMCSWCYGFAPVIAELSETFADRLPVRVVVGGLRPGTTEPMDPAKKDYIRSAWTRVAEASGQPFDMTFFDRDGFIYDTEPACRAIVTARTFDADKALPMMRRISRAFYAEGQDVTKTDVLVALADEQGFAADTFRQAFESADMRNATVRDFHFAQQAGVSGFPCLVAGREDDGYALITNGFRPIDGLPEAIEGWLKQTA